MFEELAGRTAVVSGGTGGIGRAITEALVANGVRTLVSGITQDEVDAVTAEVDCIGVPGDLTKAEGVADLHQRAQDALGTVDFLVAAHGVVHSVPSVDERIEDWQRVLDVNLTSTFALAQAFGRDMLGRGSGRIVLVASMYAIFGGLKVAAYTASKGGVAQLAKALANEWAADGVNVNAVAPGFVKTNLNEHVWGDPARSAEVVARTPAGRWGEPEDVAGPVLFLCSEAAGFLHGVLLPIDGGYAGR